MDTSQEISQVEFATNWAVIVLKRLVAQLHKKKIGVTGELEKSLHQAYKIIQNSDGNVRNIELSFLFYGRLRDMGVGRGTKLGDIKEQKRIKVEAFKNGRKAAKWYSPTMAAEIHSLAELMAKKFGIDSVSSIENSLTAELNLEL